MKRKPLIAAMCVGIIAMLGAGTYATMSYMTDSAKMVNSITLINGQSRNGEDGMNAVLTETEWDPEKAIHMVPNTTIPKNPQVRNTSPYEIPELVALKVTFVYTGSCPDASKVGKTLSATDMSYVEDCFKIDYNADNAGDWVRFSGETRKNPVQNFYYNKVLERNLPGQGDITTPLFTKITIPKDVNNTRFARVQAFGGFDIVITGEVLQHARGETKLGIGSPKDAYDHGLFDFHPVE